MLRSVPAERNNRIRVRFTNSAAHRSALFVGFAALWHGQTTRARTIGLAALDRPDGEHDYDDCHKLQQHAHSHQFLRPLRRAAARQVPQAQDKHNRNRPNRDRHQSVNQELAHFSYLAPAVG
jgi:hypothetical protein